MLPLGSPFKLGEPAFLYFWNVPISKKYPLPAYYIGQVVLQRIKQPDGEILHPVEVIGFSWTGVEWTYIVEFLLNHPEFKAQQFEIDSVEDWELEAI